MIANVDAPASQLLPLARQMQQQQQVSGLKVFVVYMLLIVIRYSM
jgi:hypothetical protein